MAGSPLKEGLDYFAIGVDFFDRDDIKMVRAKCGGDKPIPVILRLLTRIYRQGYYYTFADDQMLLLALDMGAPEYYSPEYILSVVEALVATGFFHKRTWETRRTLTSVAIQDQYVLATRRRKNTDTKLPFWLLSATKLQSNSINVDINSINVCNNSQNADNNSQSKVKESKGKKKEEEEEKPSPPSGPISKSWRDSYDIYLSELALAANSLKADKKWIVERERFHPGIDIEASIDKAIADFWGTTDGWKKKKVKPSTIIDWKRTFNNALTLSSSHVKKQFNQHTSPQQHAGTIRTNQGWKSELTR